MHADACNHVGGTEGLWGRSVQFQCPSSGNVFHRKRLRERAASLSSERGDKATANHQVSFKSVTGHLIYN